MEIKEARDALLKVLESIDKDKLSLYDLKTYAEILKTVSEIQTKTFTDYMTAFNSAFNSSVCARNATVGEMKGEIENGV